jgi:hypothetical protein
MTANMQIIMMSTAEAKPQRKMEVKTEQAMLGA